MVDAMSQSEIITLVALAAFALLLIAVWDVDRRRIKREGGRTPMSGVMGTFDEVFHPEAARAMEIREVQQELPAEAPTPGDPRATVARTPSGGSRDEARDHDDAE